MNERTNRLNLTMDSPLIEMPGEPLLCLAGIGALQATRSTQTLGSVSRVKDCGPLSLRHASVDDAAQIQRLVQALLTAENATARSLAFIGIPDVAGSRTMGLRTAECLATEHGYRVCAIDAQGMSNDAVQSCWEVENARSVQARISPSTHPTCAGELWVLDRDETSVLIVPVPGSKSRSEQLSELRDSFDYIIVCGLSTRSSASAPIVNDMEGSVLVVAAGKVRRQTLESARRVLTGTNTRLLGTVLTGRVLPIPGSLFRWLGL